MSKAVMGMGGYGDMRTGDSLWKEEWEEKLAII